MIIHEDLVHFLKNGRLENVNFGISKEHLVKLLGEPNDISQNSFADVYRYGNFEFYILKESWKNIKSERLFCILTYVSEFHLKKANFRFDTHGWTDKLTIEETVSFLNIQQIKFEEKNEFDETDVRSIYTEGNVFIQFRDWNEKGHFTLYKFGRKVELHSIKPPTKQISFEIEKMYYEQLQKIAAKTKKSIATQCREIIEKHLEISKNIYEQQ